MSRVRLALVGFGKWGRNYIKAAEDSGEAIVSMVVSRGYLIEPAECDAVVYAGHPAQAAERCKESLAEGLPILCEKPAGLSLADAERIAAAEAASNAFVLVGHQHLFADGFEKLKRDNPNPAERAFAFFSGPTARPDYSPLWDYGPHAVACLLALGEEPNGYNWTAGISPLRRATVVADDIYDGYSHQEPPLTREVRAFARAVKAGGTDDYRFGAKWAVDVARVLEACASP